MSPIMASAHFAAYIWFTGQPANAGKGPAAAMQFAHEQWPAFVKVAHPGLGRLLLKLAEAPRARRRKRRAARALAGHVPITSAAGAQPQALPRSLAVDQPFSCN
jgi:hypothetical protein